MDTSDTILKKIRDGNIKPRPRWRFVAKNSTAWIVFIIAVLFGALAFSVVLFAIQQVDFNIIAHMSHSLFELLLGLVPFFWLISLVILLAVAIVGIKNSRKGYKFTAPSLVGLCAGLSMVVGTLFFISGGGRWLENAFATQVGLYESIQEKKTKIWSAPEEGYLSGTITAATEGIIELEDFQGGKWTVIMSGADIVPSISLIPGEKIKLIGTMTSSTTFTAEKVRPWGGMNRFEKNNPGK